MLHCMKQSFPKKSRYQLHPHNCGALSLKERTPLLCRRPYVLKGTRTVSVMAPRVALSHAHTLWALWICWPGGLTASTKLSTWLGGLSLSIKPKCSSWSLINIPFPEEEGSCLRLSASLSSSAPDEQPETTRRRHARHSSLALASIRHAVFC